MDIIKKFEPFFGEWHAESFIGAGSFGRVYKIYRDEMNNRFYSAMKYISIPVEESEINQLRADGMDDDSISTYYDSIAENISSEIIMMNCLKGNTNIISFEDSRIQPKSSGIGYDIFIRMELLKNLTSCMIREPLSVDEVVKLGMDICRALISASQRFNSVSEKSGSSSAYADTGCSRLSSTRGLIGSPITGPGPLRRVRMIMITMTTAGVKPRGTAMNAIAAFVQLSPPESASADAGIRNTASAISHIRSRIHFLVCFMLFLPSDA